MGSVVTHDHVCRIIAHQSGVRVVALDYRLAPEHRYPAGLNDCYEVVEWIAKSTTHITKRLFVAGDSAGGTSGPTIVSYRRVHYYIVGNLAAAVSLKCRDSDNAPKIHGQILIYPVLTFDFSASSYSRYGYHYHLKTREVRQAWKHYIAASGKGEWGSHPYESPMQGATKDLPKTLLLTAEYDPLLDDAQKYAANLRAGSVLVKCCNYKTMHGFIELGHYNADAMDAFQQIKQFVVATANE